MTTTFQNSESAASAFERIYALTGIELSAQLFESAGSPDQALLNLEQWLRATTSPGLQLQQLIDEPELGRFLILLLGASQPLANILIQNPELSSIVFDRSALNSIPTRLRIEHEGRALLADATSYTHALDRLRFLRQRWTLPIVVNDLARLWPEPVVWKALSDVAEAVASLALEVVWQDQQKSKGFDGDCPIMAVGFGKLGGSELNYSSDVDLVYIFRDGGEEMRLSRVAEAVTRALTDNMGRGRLYRVDLRLRPYGAAGPVVCSMKAVESYYELYAEPWEVQALLRSTPIAGPADCIERWEAMRLRHCFKPMLGAEALEEALAMRARTEQGAGTADIKRGAGGIRDVEFLTQILQLAYGGQKPNLRVKPTVDALVALETEGILDHPVRTSLADGYVFLRQLEHRIQFASDQQTHDIPASSEERGRLAALMGYGTWKELERALNLHRRTIHSLYQSILHPRAETTLDRARLAEELGPFSHAAFQWFDVLPESEAFYASLVQNQDSLGRVQKILELAPRLAPMLKASLPLTELLLSGEIDEEFDAVAAFDLMPLDAAPKQLAEVYSTAWAHICSKWALSESGNLGPQLSGLTDSLIRHCAKRLYAEFDLIALGSYALGDMGLDSDADLLLLVSEKDRHLDAETQAQFLLGLVSQLKRLGAPIEIDLRLRPDGRGGLLVRTYEGFGQYELESMEMWERFALGQARLVIGSEDGLNLVIKSAYAQPLTPERLKELLVMKKRIETERVAPQHVRRDVKLGIGGLSDIEWFVHLHEMRFPTATKAGESLEMEDRIRSLGRTRLINAVEVEQLLAARFYLLDLRLRLGLQGLRKDLLPENPDKLDRLAHSMGFPNGNDLLARHESITDGVRAIYQEGLERLKA